MTGKANATGSEAHASAPPYSDSKTAQLLGELAQAKIRNYVHCVLVILTFAAYRYDDSISLNWVIYISVASIISGFLLYVWAYGLQREVVSFKTRSLQRCASIFSDNLFITLVLYIGGQSTAGIWALYIWISIGYGVRYGVRYLHANVIASIIGFIIVAYFSPFWSSHPSFAIGLGLGMVTVPLYTGWLISQLHVAVSEREKAYRAKSQFVARMSHELRTPLHAIISTTEILRGAIDTQKQRDLASIISVSSSNLLDLINQVLDISKFDSGAIALTDEPMNLNEIISATAHIVWPEAKRKGLDLRIFVDPEISENLLGSPQQLTEVLVNLLGNAAKFTQRGHISIYTFSQFESDSKSIVIFQISDTGPGIPKKVLDRIFEPFVQSDTSNTRSHGGSGLGTSFANELIRLMGGKIEVQSTEGVGTVFILAVPFIKQRIKDNLKRFYPLNLIALSNGSDSVELTKCLSRYGAKVTIANSVTELTALMEENDGDRRIDGVLVNADVFGENLGGIAGVIFGYEDSRIVPIVGYGDFSLRTAGMSIGYCSFLGEIEDTVSLGRALDTISKLSMDSAQTENEPFNEFRTKSLRILVAEDDATNRKIAKMILQEAGHQCNLVTNGDDALFELTDNRYDLAILDMHMPKRDGIEVAKIYNFSRFDTQNAIPIILFTADSTTAAKEEARSAGIFTFITKPIRPSELLDAITETYFASVFENSEYSPTNHSSGNDSNSPSNALNASSDIVDEAAIIDLLSFMTKQEQDEFFSEFSEDVNEYIKKLELAQTLDEIASAQEAMHALAGAAVTIGAKPLAILAKEIEDLDRHEVLNYKLRLLSTLRLCFDQTLMEINEKYS